MFKGFKAYNWILYLIGIGYVVLALLDAKENIKKSVEVEEPPFEECEACQDAILHIVISDDKPDNVVDMEEYRKSKSHEPA